MSTAMLIVQALIQYGPAAAKAVKEIFETEKPTQEQWDKVFAICEKSYEDYVKPKTG